MDTQLKMSVVMAAVDKITAPIKKITNQTTQLSDTMKAAKDSLAKVGAQEKDIAHFRELKKTIKGLRPHITQQQREVERLAREYEQTENPTRKMARELDRATQRLQGMRGELRSNQEQLRGVVGRLNETGIKTNKLAEHTEQLRRQSDRYNATLTETQAKLKGVAERERNLQAMQEKRQKSMQFASNATVTGAGVSYAGQQARQMVADPLMTAATYEAQISKLQALTNTSGQDLQELVDLNRKLGAETAFSAQEVAQSQEYLAKAGFSKNEILKATKSTLDLAAAGDIDLARASDIASDALSGFNMQADEMDRLVNVMAATANMANTDIGMMGESFKMSAGVAASYGGTVEEVAAMLAVMADNGIKASQSGTAVSGMYSRLTNPTAEAQRALDNLDVSIFDEVTGKAKAMPDVIKEIANATAGMSDEERSPLLGAIFGKEAGMTAGISALLKASGENDILLNKVSELEGLGQGNYAADMARAKTDNYLGRLKELESATESMKISMGTALTPAIQSLTVWITGLTRRVDAFIKENPTLAKWLGIIAIAFAGIATVLGPIMIGLGSIVGSYATLTYALGMASAASARFNIVSALGSGIMKALAAAQWLVNVAMTANPIGLVIAAVAGLIALAAYLVDDWGAVGNFFLGLWDGIKSVFSSGVDYVMGIIDMLTSPMKAISSLFDGVASWFGDDEEKNVNIKKATTLANEVSATSDKVAPAIETSGKVAQVEPIGQVSSAQTTIEGDSFEITIKGDGNMTPEQLQAFIRAELQHAEAVKQRKIRGMLNDG